MIKLVVIRESGVIVLQQPDVRSALRNIRSLEGINFAWAVYGKDNEVLIAPCI